MATNVHNLEITSLSTNTKDNKYLYLTDSRTRQDWRLSVNDLLTTLSSTAGGMNLLSQQKESISNYNLKTLKLTSDFATLKQTDEDITFAIQSSSIDLSKCNNNTSLFLKSVNLSTQVTTSILPVANGRTNKSAWAVGDVVYASPK